MDDIINVLTNIVAVGTGTWVLILLICGAAMWVIREHLQNILLMLISFPLMIGLSLIANYAMVLAQIYAANKMSEWLVWTVVAGTIGALGGVAIIAALSRLTDRQPA